MIYGYLSLRFAIGQWRNETANQSAWVGSLRPHLFGLLKRASASKGSSINHATLLRGGVWTSATARHEGGGGSTQGSRGVKSVIF